MVWQTLGYSAAQDGIAAGKAAQDTRSEAGVKNALTFDHSGWNVTTGAGAINSERTQSAPTTAFEDGGFAGGASASGIPQWAWIAAAGPVALALWRKKSA